MARSKVRIELNNENIRKLRTSPEVSAFVADVAEGIADRAGEGFEVKIPKKVGDRARARVQTVTQEAREAVAEDPTVLTNAIGGPYNPGGGRY